MNTRKIPANDPSAHDLDIAEISNGIIDYDMPQLSLAEDLLSWIKNAPPLPIDLQKELERNNVLSLDSLSEVIQSGKENEEYHVIEKMKSSLRPIPRKKFDNYLSQSFPCLTPNVVKNKIPPETQSVSFSSFEARESTEGKKSKGQVETGKKLASGFEYNDKYHQSRIKKKGSTNDHEVGITLDQFLPLSKKNHLPIPIAEEQCGKSQLREEKMKGTSSSRISNEAVDGKVFRERDELNHEFPSNDPPRGKRQMDLYFCGSCELPMVISEIKQLKGSIFCAKCYDTRLEEISSDVINEEENRNDCEEDEEGNFDEVSSVDGNDGTFKQSSVISDSDDESDANEYQDAEEDSLKDDNISPGIQIRQKEVIEGSNNDDRREKVSDESKATEMFTRIPMFTLISFFLRSEAPELVHHCNRCGEQNSEESRNCVKCGSAFY
eukprot:gene15811-17775_t